MVKTFTNLFSRNSESAALNLMFHWVLEYYKDCTNDNLGRPWPILWQDQTWKNSTT